MNRKNDQKRLKRGKCETSNFVTLAILLEDKISAGLALVSLLSLLEVLTSLSCEEIDQLRFKQLRRKLALLSIAYPYSSAL